MLDGKALARYNSISNLADVELLFFLCFFPLKFFIRDIMISKLFMRTIKAR